MRNFYVKPKEKRCIRSGVEYGKFHNSDKVGSCFGI